MRKSPKKEKEHESMKKIVALGAMLVLLAGMMTAAAAEGALTVVQKKLLVLPTDGGLIGNVYAEVSNTGNVPLQFTGGLFELFGKDGNSIGSNELNFYDLNPEVLLPGETGFFYSSIEVENASEEDYIADYSLVLDSTDQVTTAVTRYPVEAHFQTGTGEFELLRYGAAIVENKGDETLRDFFAVFALKDAAGDLLYIKSGTWASSGVVGHSKMEIRLKVDERAVDHWMEKGIVPATAEAIVFKTSPK
jgi:hypothetical protein